MKFDVKPSKRKKKDPIRDLIVTGALGYTAYKLLSKNEKKEIFLSFFLNKEFLSRKRNRMLYFLRRKNGMRNRCLPCMYLQEQRERPSYECA